MRTYRFMINFSVKHTKTLCFLARKEFVAPIAAICHLLISTTGSKFLDVIRPYRSLKLKRKIEVITTVYHKWTHTTGARSLSAGRLYLLLKYVHTDQPFYRLSVRFIITRLAHHAHKGLMIKSVCFTSGCAKHTTMVVDTRNSNQSEVVSSLRTSVQLFTAWIFSLLYHWCAYFIH